MTPLHAAAPRPRSGFTLIELLVVMAITAALGLLALMLLPGISNSDAALKGTEEVRAQVKIAQALAASSRQPRGVRFLTGGSPFTPLAATELQLLEAPPVTAIDPLALSVTTSPSNDVNGQNRLNVAPYVELTYEVATGTEPDPTSTTTPPATLPPGTVRTRQCKIFRLTADQKDQVQNGAILSLPTLGFWSRVDTSGGALTVSAPYTISGVQYYDVVTPLNVYPDPQMGVATAYRTYHAGIYGVPVPLLGQPTIPLPKNIGVDLEVSIPTAGSIGGTYDVMFSPDGQTVLLGRASSNAGVFLWVRDITKTTNPGAAKPFSMLRGDFGTNALWLDAFRRGGEHHAVGIANGFVGTAPIQWPDATGVWPAGTDAFTFARKKLN